MKTRQAFENWIGHSPYERDLRRFPDDPTIASWPGQYRDPTTQLAWEAWQTASDAKLSTDTPLVTEMKALSTSHPLCPEAQTLLDMAVAAQQGKPVDWDRIKGNQP